MVGYTRHTSRMLHGGSAMLRPSHNPLYVSMYLSQATVAGRLSSFGVTFVDCQEVAE